jgi:hypothetical protein
MVCTATPHYITIQFVFGVISHQTAFFRFGERHQRFQQWKNVSSTLQSNISSGEVRNHHLKVVKFRIYHNIMVFFFFFFFLTS